VLVALVFVAVKVGVCPATGLSLASFRVMVTADDAVPLATIFDVPLMVEKVAKAEPAVKVTLPPVLETGVTIDNVLISALVDFKVQVETPEAFVAEQVE
jgi:hypothetical protein